MITRTEPSVQTNDWQKQQAQAIRAPERLIERLNLEPGMATEAQKSTTGFTLRVPESFVARMQAGNPNDPLLRQILPTPAELQSQQGYLRDPVGDQQARPLPGLLHKYQGRVLIMTTGACGVHCRYCFRRHYPYQDEHLLDNRWQQILHYIRSDDTIEEVILSGGDPLTLNDKRLATLLEDLEGIVHLRRLRIHSRQPVVLPSRINEALLLMLQQSRLNAIMVIHANHPNELDDEVQQSMRRLRDSGTQLLNQSVLLKGINNHADTLAHLSQRLIDCGVMPYYLHQLDKVEGAAHFEVGDTEAKILMAALRQRLPGYMVPKLVREEAGAPAKLPLESAGC